MFLFTQILLTIHLAVRYGILWLTSSIIFLLVFFIRFLLYCFRLIVQAVERTAHNGGVVGSNPTKPS